mgnify:CR=1 FL=1
MSTTTTTQSLALPRVRSSSIVTSLTDDLIMPVIGLALGGLDLNSHFALLGSIPATYTGSPTDYLALKKAGVKVDRRIFDGVTHEFFGTVAAVKDAGEAQKYAGQQLRQAFGN